MQKKAKGNIPDNLCGSESQFFLRKASLKFFGLVAPKSRFISWFNTVLTASGRSLLSDTIELEKKVTRSNHSKIYSPLLFFVMFKLLV